MNQLLKVLVKKISRKSVKLSFFPYAALCLYIVSLATQANQNSPTITKQQANALKMLNQQGANTHQVKSLRLKVKKLSDNQGQVYLGAAVSRADLSPYLTQLKNILKEEFESYRANQAARDHQTFHMTLLSPKEYQLADKALIEKLLSPDFNSNFSSQLNVTLLGLGNVKQDRKQAFFVVVQSGDAQLIRQHFLLQPKDFHVTVGFNPSDIYSLKKDSTTLVDFKVNL